MTDTAVLVRRRMVISVYFTYSQYTVMTGLAVVHDPDMIKRCRHEARGLMTVSTITVGRHMVVGFTGGGITIVT